MSIDLDKLRKALKNITQEDIDKYFPDRNIPSGWVSIEDHLPMMLAEDIEKGCTEYNVRYGDGEEGVTCVSDHNTWYYFAKNNNITHWWNE